MPLLDIPTVAERLSTTERHVRALVARRALPVYKVGQLVRIDSDDLDAWLEGNRRAAEAVVA